MGGGGRGNGKGPGQADPIYQDDPIDSDWWLHVLFNIPIIFFNIFLKKENTHLLYLTNNLNFDC